MNGQNLRVLGLGLGAAAVSVVMSNLLARIVRHDLRTGHPGPAAR